MDKLKPCPFCGDKQHVTHVELSNGLHYVECKRCGAAPHRLGAWDYETAVKYWNSVNRWIPCSERMPNESGEYLVCGRWSGEEPKTWICRFAIFGDIGGFVNHAKNPNISFWMPMPEPPEKE